MIAPHKDFQAARALDDQGVLLPYQRRWVEDQAEVKVVEKSRRIGISWAEASDDVLYAASISGDDVWYIGYNKDMAGEFIGDCAAWARRFQEAASAVEETVFADEKKDILSYLIRFASGHKITALSSRPTNLRGKQGRVIIDESAFHDDLPGLLKAALAFLIWGGQVRVISTHFGETNEFNSLVQDIRAGRKPYSLHRVDFDEALADGLYRRICQVLRREWSPEAEATWRQKIIDTYGDDAEEELFCVPSQGSGVFLTRALIETCLDRDLPVLRYAQPPEFTVTGFEDWRRSVVQDWLDAEVAPLLDCLDPRRRSYLGEDFGRKGDLTAIMPLVERQDASFYAPFIVELRGIPFKQQEQIFCYIADRLPRFSYGALDAGGNGMYLAEAAIQKYGASRIEAVTFSESWYRDNMPRLKAAFEDKSILLPYDADVIEDLRAFKVVKGVARLPDLRTMGQDKGQRHGDVGIAAALAWYSTRFEGAVIEFQSTGRRRATAGRAMNAFLGR
ncbi:MAG: hypothetical protein AB1641_09865 [Thermodesulfobacteriota bacterium]